jgi:hypothetical protein
MSDMTQSKWQQIFFFLFCKNAFPVVVVVVDVVVNSTNMSEMFC